MFKKVFEPPRFRPAINVGCLLDVPTGKYELGKHGESLLNGGVTGITGICARPNNFKTALLVYMMAMIRRACHKTHQIVYDSEGTFNGVGRFTSVSINDSYLSAIDWRNDDQTMFTDLSQYTGDGFFDLFRKTLEEKGKENAKYEFVTPFIDHDGNKKRALYPTSGAMDSLSRMTVSQVEETYSKNKIGDSGMNTEAMNNGRAKKQMFNQLPGICARYGTYLFLTAHIKDVINIEMYPTDKRALSFMKKDTSLEGVSGGFYSLPNNLIMITGNKPMIDSKKKTPIYPWDNKTAMEGDTDLSCIVVMNIRGKNGISGIPMEIMVSQSEGILASLTDFHYCKTHDYFGLLGNQQNYAFALYPDVKLSRTTVRQKLQGDHKLEQAAHFTSEILQIMHFHRMEDQSLLCDMETLYNDLKAIGYDWDVLLNTRYYWVPEDEEKDQEYPYLTGRDLLRMRKGLYIPYWFTKEQKAALNPDKFIS
jgi:hypothetical protein